MSIEPDSPRRVPIEPDPPRSVQVAVGCAAVEGLSLLALAMVIVNETLTAEPSTYAAALIIAVMTAVVGIIVCRLALEVGRLHGWARSPLLVLQILGWPVGYSLAVQAGRPVFGVPILALCVVCVGALFMPAAREALRDW